MPNKLDQNHSIFSRKYHKSRPSNYSTEIKPSKYDTSQNTSNTNNNEEDKETKEKQTKVTDYEEIQCNERITRVARNKIIKSIDFSNHAAMVPLLTQAAAKNNYSPNVGVNIRSRHFKQNKHSNSVCTTSIKHSPLDISTLGNDLIAQPLEISKQVEPIPTKRDNSSNKDLYFNRGRVYKNTIAIMKEEMPIRKVFDYNWDE